MVAGAVTGAAAGASRASAPPAGGGAIFHGFGREPGWVLDVFADGIVFAPFGAATVSVDTPPVTTTFEGHRYTSEGLTITIAHASCGFTSGGPRYPASVTVSAGGREYRGCGTELAAH